MPVADAANGSGTRSIAYDWADRPVSQTWQSGSLAGITVSNHFGPKGRDALDLLVPSNPQLHQGYGYDSYGRFGSITNLGAGSQNINAAYQYVPSSDLLQQTTFYNGATSALNTTRTWDSGVRLRKMSSSTASVISSHDTTFDGFGRRHTDQVEDNSIWTYDYNDRNELISARRSWADSSIVAGQQYGYVYDNIGNRQTNTFGGDQNGNNLQTNIYAANNLNQYSSETVPGYAQVLGSALGGSVVCVETNRAVVHSNYFCGQVGFSNANSPVWTNVRVAAFGLNGTTPTNVALTNGYVYIPKTPVSFAYDPDGNLLRDGRWTNTWDAENRLTRIESLADASTSSKRRLDLAYDYQNRRVQKIASTDHGSGYVACSTSRYIYDGWNLVAILDQNNTPQLTFTWGTDASGTLQDAGGIGGLISMTVATGPQAGTYLYCYDANFNVTALINAADGSIAACYEYSPFGELLRSTGPLAKLNPFRFSTKFTDDETDLIYYGYRYYSPSLGRWISRDPSGEDGGLHLWLFRTICG